MRLSKIKLSGFKSFVEPTTISFPSQRVAIVGPNGCGKSNVIDAVRWVMGELSAKHLRGASMTDVIFNGSHTRQPINQASIELVFEEVNMPPYPEHSEVSVKRQISRNGDSTYLINHVRCRRKDITDLFLGTGLGPRSYAIIEQGTISRLIEARPEELRWYLEEAAGISKYKERRKETEQRMKQTQENLARLEEVRNELAQQLDKLQKQAKQAEKFTELRKEEELHKAQLLAIRWNALDIAVQEQQHGIEEKSAQLQKDVSALQNFDEFHKQQREAQTVARHTLNETQARFYDIQAKLNRVEQDLAHIAEREEQLQLDMEEVTKSRDMSQRTLSEDEQQVAELETALAETEAQLSVRQETELFAQQALQDAEAQLEEWQEAWEDFNQRAAGPTQTAQVERTRLQNLEQRLEQNQRRLLRLEEEGKGIDVAALEQALRGVETEMTAVKSAVEEAEERLQGQAEQVSMLREKIHQKSAELSEQQTRMHQLSGRLASLEALQEAALGKNSADLEAWLHNQKLRDAPRLAESLQVEKGWERAVEVVLGEILRAVCVEDLGQLQKSLEKPPQGELALFEIAPAPAFLSLEGLGKLTAAPAPTPAFLSLEGLGKLPLLAHKIQSPWPLPSLLFQVRTAESLAEAYQLRSQLSAHESIITKQGLWLGPNWLCSQQGTDEKAGVLARTQEIDRLASQLQALEQAVQQWSQELESQRVALQNSENNRSETQHQVNALQRQLSDLQAQSSGKQARLEHIKMQVQRIAKERAEVTTQMTEDQSDSEATRKKLHAALEAMDKLADERETLTKQRNVRQEKVMQSRVHWHEAKESRHQGEVKLESQRTDIARLQQGITRLKAQLEQFQEQGYELQTALQKQRVPLDNLQRKLTDYQQQKTVAEEALTQAKQTVAHLEVALNDYEGLRHEVETRSQTLRTELEQARLECQTHQVRRQTLEEQLATTPWSPLALLAELPEDANEDRWQEQIQTLERKLERLGAINMAALQEFEEESKRKQFLDEQAEDLHKALNLLENAIATIDRETKTRFQHTLDSVNKFLQDMFPKLFGGGQASLELVGEDILADGVSIMARPPGKRNTHIHLLSGGEKALTAIALVFAIFELNPAPFCMLDEVDAPLDDTNVGRFCRLVKAMSERVQFIFITHNKLTMEIADQLMGVTMQEPGVSRMVAVDINTAVDMVAK